MFKKAISLLLTISLLIPSGAFARRTEMSQDRFVHLTDQEKNQMIVLTMEMMAELEENYNYEVSVNGPSPELQQKYTSIMKRLYDFLISEASAAEASKAMEWKQYAEKFRGAVESESKKSDKCFFAGWPSKIQPQYEWVEAPVSPEQKKSESVFVDEAACSKAKEELSAATVKYQEDLKRAGQVPMQNKAEAAKIARIPYDAAVAKTEKACAKKPVETAKKEKPKKVKKFTGKMLCMVPDQLDDHSSPEYKAYKEHLDLMGKGAKCKSSEISCNPSIFGFKSASDKSVFCVPSAFGTPAENASHSCMKKAMAEPPEKGADNKEDRLKFMREALSDESNSGYVKSIYEYMEKLCLCDSKDLDAKVKGQVNDAYLKKIKPHRTCYAMMEMMGQTLTCTSPLAATSGMDLGFFEKIKALTQSNPKLLDQKSDIEAHYKKYLEEVGSSKEYGYLCKGEKKPEPVVVPEPVKIAKTYVCKEVKDCAADAPAAPIEGAATAAPVIVSCKSVSVFVEGDDKTNLAKTPLKGEAGKDVEYEFPTGEGEEKAKVTCKIPELPKEEAPKACSLKLDGEDKKIKATVSLEKEEADKYEMVKFKWGDKESTSPTEDIPWTGEAKLSVKVDVELKAKAGGKTAKTSCSAEKEPKKKEEDPKLKLTDGEVKDKSKFAIAKVEGKFEGWEIFWEAKGDGAPDKEEEKKDVKLAPDSEPAEKGKGDPSPTDAGTSAGPEKKSESKKFTSKGAAQAENKLEQPRAKADYEVCAKLIKGDKTVPGDKCIQIPKLAEEAAPTPPPAPDKDKKQGLGGGMPPMGPPPVPFRGNTRWGNAGSL